MPNLGNRAVTSPGQKLIERPITGVLDQSVNPAGLPPGGISVLQNYVYRESRGLTKRTGSGIDVGTGATGSGLAIKSGVRWARGLPSATRQMIVHSGDALYLRNDTTGAYTSIATLAAGSSPAFFASAYDPAESGVSGTPASDVLIITYGSGVPLKWDGTNMTNLSSSITNHFTGCEAWHNHVWFWGDPNNPGIVFGTDINNPESYTFSSNFGGYQIGPGDGDPSVQRVFGDGMWLYIWKGNGIWGMQGYDYYAGNYQFSLTPLISGTGTTAPFSVGRLSNLGLIPFWSGSRVQALVSQSNPGTLVDLSVPIDFECGNAANGSQSVIRGVAGSFIVQVSNGNMKPYRDVYLLAVDDGSGQAQRVLVYDGVKSAEGKPAWSVFLGWNVGAWIPWQGANDQRLLYFGSGQADLILLVGQNPLADNGTAFVTSFQLNRDGCDSDDQDKWLDFVYLRLDAGVATFQGTMFSGAPAAARTFAASTVGGVGLNWGGNWGGIWGANNSTTYQSAIGRIDAWLRGKNFTLYLTESSTTSVYEVLGYAMHVIEEAYPRS